MNNIKTKMFDFLNEKKNDGIRRKPTEHFEGANRVRQFEKIAKKGDINKLVGLWDYDEIQWAKECRPDFINILKKYGLLSEFEEKRSINGKKKTIEKEEALPAKSIKK